MKLLLVMICLGFLAFAGCGVKGDPEPYVEQLETKKRKNEDGI
jgi:hypothetical protein